MTIDRRQTLNIALDQLGALVARVEDDDLGLSTPCAEWTVRELLDHVVQTVTNLAEATRGGSPDFAAPAPHVEHRVQAFDVAADQLRAAWVAPADPAGDPRSSTSEIAVHSWDLVTALGITTASLEPRVAEDALAFMGAHLTPEGRGGMFAPEVAAPEDAGPYERLAAFAGRSVPRA